MTWDTITSPHTTGASQFAGDYLNKLSKLLNGLDVGALYDPSDQPVIGTSWTFKEETLRLQGGNFNYNILTESLDNDVDVTIPYVTENTKFALLGAENEFTNTVRFIKDTSNAVLTLVRPTSAQGNGCRYDLALLNDEDEEVSYGQVRSEIGNNDAGAEEGRLIFSVAHGGSMDTAARIEDTTGKFRMGGFNERSRFSDELQTAVRDYTTPNNDCQLTGVVAKSGVTTTISNNNTEQDILNYVVSADRLGTNGILKVKISGYLLANSGTPTFTFAIKFGGTTMWADATAALGASATKLPFRIEFELYNKNSVSAQGLSGRLMINDTTAATTGIGDISDDETLVSANFDSEGADTTKNTASNQTLQVTVTMSVANANVQTVVKNYSIELMT